MLLSVLLMLLCFVVDVGFVAAVCPAGGVCCCCCFCG